MLELFELSVAFKYLVPRRKHLSVALIAMMSVAVISLVVWLLLVFLSVTEGIEQNWLKKLTDLNAPIRITPTQNYYSSYYYNIDSLSQASHYTLKTLGEKRIAPLSDPYDPDEDPEIPPYWPKPVKDAEGRLIDPVKQLDAILQNIQKSAPPQDRMVFQDYEMSGALLKLQLLRNQGGQEQMHFLTQASYLSTPPPSSHILSSLLLPPTLQDINHLFFLANYRMEREMEDGAPTLSYAPDGFQEKVAFLLSQITPLSFQTEAPFFELPSSFLPLDTPFVIQAQLRKEGDSFTIENSFLPTSPHPKTPQSPPPLEQGEITRRKDQLTLTFPHSSIKKSFTLPLSTKFRLDGPILFSEAKINLLAQGPLLEASGTLQGKPLQKGTLPWKHLLIHSFVLKKPPSFQVFPTHGNGILLPKGFQENGARLGDRGFLSYHHATTSHATQEQRLPVFVAGFYDPGLISVGNKCLLVPQEVTRTINASFSHGSESFDRIALNGFQVWIDGLEEKKILSMKEKIQNELQKEGVASYFDVSCYRDYDFAKDLLQQFQSDKILLSLIGILILTVACCNIISFLILLVNDKKKEIAILRAMGASTRSIALIFGVCGMSVGMLGCLLGVGGALLTLEHIDSLARILSSLQGHDAFLPAFYGTSLPSQLSHSSTLFLLIATPILSLLSGLIPALKACRLSPSSLLRAES